MKRLLVLAAVVVALAGAAGARAPAADAVASCGTVYAGGPALTMRNGDYYLTSAIHVADCAAKTYFLTTLLVESGGTFNETGCDGQAPPSCAHAWPTTGGGCDGGIHFCAYGNVWRYPETDPNGNICGRNFRSRVQVYNVNGDQLAQVTSTTTRC